MDHSENGQRTVGGRGGFEISDQAVLVLLQVKNGLKEDGKVGPATMAVIDSKLGL